MFGRISTNAAAEVATPTSPPDSRPRIVQSYLETLRPIYEDGEIVEIHWETYVDLAWKADLSHLRRARISAEVRWPGLVSFLRDCDQLEILECIGRSANATTIQYVNKLPRLYHLFLRSSYGGEGLAELATLPSLTELDLAQCSIEDHSLMDVTMLHKLRYLNLSDTQVTDAGLSELLALKNLESLWLDGTAVTDAGLTTLAQLPALKELHVARTRVTPAGIAAFQSQRPDVVVTSTPADSQ